MIERRPQFGDLELLRRGSSLGEAQIERLCSLLAEYPEARDARLMLMGARNASAQVRADQALWFVNHEPTTFLGVRAIHAARPKFDEVASHWLAAAETYRDNIDVVSNAAWFLLHSDPERGGEILEERARTEREPEWALRAITFYVSASNYHHERRALFAVRALRVGFLIFRRDDGIQSGHTHLLSVMRLCAKRASDDVATRYLTLAESTSRTVDTHDPVLRAQFDGAVGGLVSLAESDTERATQQFRAASRVEALPTDALLLLANELVMMGLMETILPEIESWSGRFRACADATENWAAALRRGARSAPPVFRQVIDGSVRRSAPQE